MDYSIAGPRREAHMAQSYKITQEIFDHFYDVFPGIGYFTGIFSLHVKENTMPYHVLPRHVVYAFQEPFRKELEWIQGQK